MNRVSVISDLHMSPGINKPDQSDTKTKYVGRSRQCLWNKPTKGNPAGHWQYLEPEWTVRQNLPNGNYWSQRLELHFRDKDQEFVIG